MNKKKQRIGCSNTQLALSDGRRLVSPFILSPDIKDWHIASKQFDGTKCELVPPITKMKILKLFNTVVLQSWPLIKQLIE